ncbi:hypothetical protein NM208_g6122 [Fusarium decemcellulare]|uniref:Uncharacterized protein n=1 Tax=Fusarium decemcellulare TaxID=57161 RepID=A0ACC1SEG8_9HYPO|nr:hypothetical protein NM208_g6122 [Fusarium decemcellulare]
MAVSIAQVSFEHHREPIGIGEAEPRISWRFDGNSVNWEQSSYELEVRRKNNDTVEAYTVESANSLFNPWPGNSLSSSEAATVRVKAFGQGGQTSTPWSDWVTVEAGLLSDDDWAGATPISAKRSYNASASKRPVYFRKGFSVDGEAISSARLYITALGLYEAEINGERVGDHVLAPGWQSYNYRHVYDTYDVTDLVKDGDNAIGVVVGEGWFSGRLFSFAPGTMERNFYGDDVGVISLLIVTLQNGKVIKVPTDSSWKASVGPITDSQIYDGEIYDSRLEEDIKGWSTASFDSKDWWSTSELPALKGKLSSPDGPPVRRIEERRPERIWKSPSGKTLVDFGQNLVGWVRLKVGGSSGTNVTIYHAEILQEGELDRGPLRSAKARDTFILNGEGIQTLEPHFTYHGFQYAQVDGWPEGEPLNETSITAIVIHSDMEETGWLETSNPLLNQLHHNTRWSMKGNFLTIPTDCPQRDERMGWTGDALAFGPTANFLYDCSGFWKGWHRDVWADMQLNDTMIVPYIVPIIPPDRPISPEGGIKLAPTAIWGDIAISGPWQIWQTWGDVDMLADQYLQSKAWIDIGIDRDDTGLWNKTGYQWGDWLDPLAPESAPGNATTARHLVADAYLIGMTDIMVNMSQALGNTSAANEYRKQGSDLRKAFESTWLRDGKMANKTQTAYSLGIYFNLFRDAKDLEAAGDTLRNIIEENDYKVGTGFAGTWNLGHTLSTIGAADDFYKMLLQTEIPSWLYQVAQNATTTWERWDSLLRNGTTNGSGMTSFNHYAVGSVSDWMHRNIGGLSAAAPGWKTIKIAPVPGGGITYSKARFISGYGEVRVHWWFEDNKEKTLQHRNGFHLNAWVPPNSDAIITLPGSGQSEKVGSGFHEFHDPEYLMT